MAEQLGGIHHLTAITADAPGNLAFYTEVLGLQLVKKTVNQDDTTAYHLFYADGKASPGSDVTFFDWPVGRERRGTRAIARTALRVASEASLAWWRDRLLAANVKTAEIADHAGYQSLDFEDAEGQRLRLVNDKGAGESHPWEKSPVPAAHQIRGLGPITLSVPDLKPTAALLTQILNMTEVRTHPLGNGKTSLHVFAMGAGGPAAELHVAVEPHLPVSGPRRRGRPSCRLPHAKRRDTPSVDGETGKLQVSLQRRSRALLFPLALFPRTQRHPVRDRN